MKSQREAMMFAKVEAWERSGQTLKAYAAEIGIARTALEYWVRKKRANQVAKPSFVELLPQVREDTSGMPSFVSPQEQGRQSQIEITFPGGMRVKIYG